MHHRLAMLAIAVMAVAATGAAAQTRGVTKTDVTLGLPTDLSGVAATHGVSSSNAIKMRFDEINDAGGIHGRKIRVVVEDQGYQVPKAVQACNKLINRDKVFAFVGALGTPMNNACFKDQLAAEVPNLFPLSAARSMFEPFHRLKFYNAATYVDQLRSAVNYFVKEKGKKAVCIMYQDTDAGKEFLEGVELQAKKLGIELVERTTHKPTDQDFTAPITKLRQAGCDLIAMGTIVRDSIVPYVTARKMGWNDVVFVGSAAAYDLVVGAAQGMDGFHAMGLTEMPYADSTVASVRDFVDRYRKKFNIDPNIGAVYGYVGADLTVAGLKNAGVDLTLDSFIKGMEAIKNHKDIFDGPPVSFGPQVRQGANSSFLAEVKGGRWTRVTPPLGF
ncbi:ABC transporter substrate-binding protein [Reyranella sp. CPCC 100927]|uniref:ABC transporter substrate-binding protein n=1 Tax=Reyranella sp. CPCC 100927 TaxID=2599616 RepID=UPI0011B3EDF9|nr:ABC transporter substrate-binding protein [Reyranella sp. CPCC 100927]TWT10046.1 ABC transporter substrate-binding protein [Reyranella sp. CPCC 100927]